MKEFIAIATVSYYNDVGNTTETENIVLTEVENYVDAMERIEKYYSHDIEDVHVVLLEGPFLTISDMNLDMIMKGNI